MKSKIYLVILIISLIVVVNGLIYIKNGSDKINTCKIETNEKNITNILKTQKCFEKRVEIKEDSKSLSGLGWTHLLLEDYDNAIYFFSKAIEMDSNYYDPYQGLGEVYQQKKEYNNSIKYFNKAIELNSNNYKIYTDLIYVYRNNNQCEKAEENCNIVKNFETIDYNTKNEIISVMICLNKYNEALEYYESNNMDDKRIINPNIKIGTKYLYNKDFEKAFEIFNKINKSEIGENNLYYAWSYYKNNEYKIVKEYLTNTMNITGLNSLGHSMLGWTYYKLNDTIKAKYHLEKSVQNTTDPITYCGYTQFLITIKEFTEAKIYINKCIKYNELNKLVDYTEKEIYDMKETIYNETNFKLIS